MKPSDFTIKLRVRVRGNRPIAGIEEPQAMMIDGVNLSVQLRPPILILSGSGFSTEAEAQNFLPRLFLGLWNVAIKLEIAFKPIFKRLDIYRPEDPIQAAKNLFGTGEGAPIKVDGAVSGEGYFIHPTVDRISCMTGQDANISITNSWELVKNALLEGIESKILQDISADLSLLAALDLYASSFYESTIRAQFISLVSCLEVLAPKLGRHQSVIDMFGEFEGRLNARLRDAADNLEREAIQSVLNDTRWKKEASISERIRRLLHSVASGSDSDRRNYAKRVIKAYGIRSKLLHKGAVDPRELDEATLIVRKAVKRVLTSRLGLP